MHQATTITGQEDYKIKTTKHQLIADEPKEVGGTDTGTTPMELLASSLASCSTITMKMYANRKEWPIEAVEVHVEFENDIKSNVTQFYKKIKIKGELTEQQTKRLYKMASRCPVHRILENSIEVNSELIKE